MRTRRPLTVAAALVVVALVTLAACGDDDGDTVEAGQPEDTTTTSAAPPAEETTTTIAPGGPAVTGDMSLTIRMTDGQTVVLEGTLTCEGDRVEGTGYLADPAAARTACEFLSSNRQARNRLLNGRPGDLMCTQQYGGPEVLKITGSIDGQRVDQKIDQTDGCGIADFRLLSPLLSA